MRREGGEQKEGDKAPPHRSKSNEAVLGKGRQGHLTKKNEAKSRR